MSNGASPPAVRSPTTPRIKKATVPATPLARTRRARRIAVELAVEFPEAPCELDFGTPLELSVATVLSAQTTDVRVNLVTPILFARYPDAAAYAGADRVELEEIIRSTGFYRNKATAVIALGAALVERFGGEVPRTLDELVTLPGIGRKTANVVLGNAFGLPGITVDTHLGRLMQRWGLTDTGDPVKIERDLAGQLPKDEWTEFSNRAIYHGRRVCHAKKPACGVCRLAPLCPAYGAGPIEKEPAAALVTGVERDHLLALAGLGPAEPGPAGLGLAGQGTPGDRTG